MDVGIIGTTGRRFGIASELVLVFVGHPRWWMLPLIFAMLLAAVVIILAQSPALAPFL